MLPRSIEYRQVHVRTALHLLGQLDHQLRVLGLVMPEHYHLFRLLAAARRQLWLSLTTPQTGSDRMRWWAPAGYRAWKRSWAVMILLEVVGGCAIAVGFVLSCVWRYVRSALHVLWRN